MGALIRIRVGKFHEHWWRLLACIWLNAGVIDLLSTSLCVAFIGIRIEQQFGFVRMGLIYILSGLGGSILSCLFLNRATAVGASGALCGLVGAILSEHLTNWKICSDKVLTMFILLGIITFNLGLGTLPRIDNFDHIGGFVVGFLLGFILLPRRQYDRLEQRQYILGIISLILLIVGLSIGLVLLFRGFHGYEHCHWCHYLTCPDSNSDCNFH